MYMRDTTILSRSDRNFGPGVSILARERSRRVRRTLVDDQLSGDDLEGLSLKGIAKAVKKVAAPVQKAVAKGAKAVGKVVTSKVGQTIIGGVLAATGVGLPAAAAIGAAAKAGGTALQGKKIGTIAKAGVQGAAVGAAGSIAGTVARKGISLVKREKIPAPAPVSKLDELTAKNQLPEISQLPSTAKPSAPKLERVKLPKLDPSKPRPKPVLEIAKPIEKVIDVAKVIPLTPVLKAAVPEKTADDAKKKIAKALGDKAKRFVREARDRAAAPAPTIEPTGGGSPGFAPSGGGGSAAPIEVAQSTPASAQESSSGGGVMDFVKQNPLAVGAGVLAIGVGIAALAGGRRS